MTPTTQTREGWPYGDCVRASYATILGLPFRFVPRFDPAALRPGESQRQREREWLGSMGIDLLEYSTAPDPMPADFLEGLPPVEHLISGLSPRGFGHRCVGFAGRVEFDPHPSRAGLTKIWSVGFLVPQC